MRGRFGLPELYVPGQESGAPFGVVEVHIPDLRQQLADGTPWLTVEQRVVALGDDEATLGVNADRGGDWLL